MPVESLCEFQSVAMETGPRYPGRPSPELSNCEHSDGRLLMTHAEAWTGSRLRKKGSLGASGSPAAVDSTGCLRHLSGSLGREAGGPTPRGCVTPTLAPGSPSPASGSEPAQSPGPKRRLNRPDACRGPRDRCWPWKSQ